MSPARYALVRPRTMTGCAAHDVDAVISSPKIDDSKLKVAKPVLGSICLLTPGHLSTNPRLTKEADALVSAGFEVCVLAADYS